MNIVGRQPVSERAIVETDAGTQYAFEAEAPFSLDIHRIYAALRRNLKLFAGVLFIALVLGVIATMLMTPKYTATGSIQIDQDAARVLKADTDVDPLPSAQDQDRYLQTQADILRSRAMAVRVVRELRLLDSPRFFAAMGSSATYATLSPEERREATLQMVLNNLTIDLPRQSRVVTIAFESPDPQLAAQIVNAYARSFIQSNLQRKYDSSSYARDFLSRQLADSKEKLEASERALNNYARDARLIKTQIGSNAAGGAGQASTQSVTTASLVQLNEVSNSARAARIAAEQKWNSARDEALLSIPAVLSNQAVQELLQERAKRVADLREERARHLDSYPTVLQLTEKVGELDRQITTLATGIRNGIRGDYEVALRQEQALEGQVGQLKNATLAEQDRGVRYGILAREADTNRAMYDGMLQRFKELSASAGLASNNISIIDEAERPTHPSSPRLFLNLVLALFGGLAAALGIVLLRERLDDAIRVPEDAERKLELPVVGLIPRVKEGTDVLEELSQPRSALAEAYHALRTSLIYSSAEGLPRSLLVTSSQASEGKSTTSFAIAHDLSRIGKRVILVDTDLRRPTLHATMGTDNTIGLVDLITHRATSESPIRPTAFENLWFIPSGPIPPNPTELLSSSRMRELVGQLRQEFDVLVMDGPPVLGLADAPILGALSDATVFVIEADRSRRGGAKAAIRRLRNAHAQLIGCVLTKFDSKKAGTQYYAYEYYYYGSEPATEETSPGRAIASA